MQSWVNGNSSRCRRGGATMKFFLWIGPILRSSSSMIVPRFPSSVFFNLIGLVAFEMATPTMGTRSASMKTTVRRSLPSVYNWMGSFTRTLLSPNTNITCNQQSEKFSVINANPSFWSHTAVSVWRLLSDLKVKELSCQCKQVSTLAVDPEIQSQIQWKLAGLMQPPPVSWFCTADSPGGLGREGERGCCCGEEQRGHISTVSLKRLEDRPK